MSNASLLSVLRERAGLQANDPAFTYTDYDVEADGVAETLTWSQMFRRTINVAIAVAEHGAVGDRAVVVAPQGLHYIAAFLGAMQAGRIAVPLSTPAIGSHDERISAVFADTQPTVVLTTSAIADSLTEYVTELGIDVAVIAVDHLDLDGRNGSGPRIKQPPSCAYLQYTSGSTRTPAGVMVTDRNLTANFEQLMADYFPYIGGMAPSDTTPVTWLPFYHDMGLMLGVIAPILGGYHARVTNPMAFLAKPARWIQAMASHPNVYSAAPNFAFELAVRRTTDEDMAGYDLSNVLTIVSGSERVHPSTLDRFVKKFGPYGFRADMMTPSYGMAEATVYVAALPVDVEPKVVHFDPEKLADGTAERTTAEAGAPLLSYGTTDSVTVRIVDADTATECPPGTVGEIWVHGDNVSPGYWSDPESRRNTFGGVLAAPSAGTPERPWLRTGDLGFVSDGEMFIVGRVKDLLIVRGRNHYPEDIEATVSEITGGRVAAIAIEADASEKLVTVIEYKKRGTDEEFTERVAGVRNDVTAAISRAHGLNVADLVLVAPGSIPTTTSGKIRRAACVEQYRRQAFARLDA